MKCGKLHPTLLHGIKPSRHPVKQKPKEKGQTPAQETPKEDASEPANVNTSTCGSSSSKQTEEGNVITTMFVPVVFSHKDRPNIEICVYALLDDGSDSTFIIKFENKRVASANTNVHELTKKRTR